MLTPPHAAGAIAMIQLDGDVDAMLGAMRIKPIAVGGVALRNLAGVDEGLVARWSQESCVLMPHGGVGVVRALLDAVRAAGIVVESHSSIAKRMESAKSLFSEARSDVEALTLLTLTRAASPLAVELLLKQHELWNSVATTPDGKTDGSSRSHGTYSIRSQQEIRACSPRDLALRRLIDPPLIVMLGQSNVGKSTLTNALAKRHVSIVADEPGTTRDHVGVMLDMAGLVVRFVDTPGLRDDPTPEEAAARDIALDLAMRADLLLLVGTAKQPPPTGLPAIASQTLTIALQSDVGLPTWPHDLPTSAKTGVGLERLVASIRETLIPAGFLEENGPWRFW